MHVLGIRKNVKRKLIKLAKKDPQKLQVIKSKILEILENPLHYKNLRKPLNHLRRVHIGSFVLVFSIIGNKVIIENFEHHDKVYK